MAMRLDRVVPFGRTLDEYINIFHLSDADLNKRILGVGDGPASFNAEGTAQGKSIISIDPVYEFSGDQIEMRFNDVVDDIIDQVEATPQDWSWTYHRSPQDLRQTRILALKRFLADYQVGKQEGRYLLEALPSLSFTDQFFELALCSHFLFLYSEQVDYDFHRASIYEMLRVSAEIRIFPLMTLMLTRSPHLEPLILDLRKHGYRVFTQRVPYELQRGGNEMLVVQNP